MVSISPTTGKEEFVERLAEAMRDHNTSMAVKAFLVDHSVEAPARNLRARAAELWAKIASM